MARKSLTVAGDRPEPPEWMDAAAKPDWDAACDLLASADLLHRVDANTLAEYCELGVAARRAKSDADAYGGAVIEVEGSQGQSRPVKNPGYELWLSTLKQRATLGAKLGMAGPRTRIGLTPAGEAQNDPDADAAEGIVSFKMGAA